MAMLEGVAPGLTMEFIAQAVNGSAQSLASDPITVTTPPLEAEPAAAARTPSPMVASEETTAPEAELASLAAISPNGNGTANGNGSNLAVSRVS